MNGVNDRRIIPGNSDCPWISGLAPFKISLPVPSSSDLGLLIFRGHAELSAFYLVRTLNY